MVADGAWAVADEASVEAVAVSVAHHRCRVSIGLHPAHSTAQVPVLSTAQVPARLIAQAPVPSTAQVAVHSTVLVVQVRFNDPRDLVPSTVALGLRASAANVQQTIIEALPEAS